MNSIKRFDHCVSNPPYQDEKNSAIFHKFQEVADKISIQNSLIYPADKWTSRSGKGIGLDEFSKVQLNDPHVENIIIYENANTVFGTIEMHGGVSIVTKNKNKNNNGILKVSTINENLEETMREIPHLGSRTLSTSNTMNRIVEKVLMATNSFPYDVEFLDSVVCPTSIYGINSSFIQNSKSAMKPDVFLSANNINKDEYVKVLSNEVNGRGGRVGWFYVHKSEIPKIPTAFEKYTVAISTRHAAGYGGRSQQARIFKPGEVFGDSRFGVRVFDDEKTARNFLKWMGTDVIRFLILSSSRRIKNFGANVPLLPSYESSYTEVDFSEDSLNGQLIELFGLDDTDVELIEKTVSTLGSFEMGDLA